jgi:hypothetical protein
MQTHAGCDASRTVPPTNESAVETGLRNEWGPFEGARLRVEKGVQTPDQRYVIRMLDSGGQQLCRD